MLQKLSFLSINERSQAISNMLSWDIRSFLDPHLYNLIKDSLTQSSQRLLCLWLCWAEVCHTDRSQSYHLTEHKHFFLGEKRFDLGVTECAQMLVKLTMVED